MRNDGQTIEKIFQIFTGCHRQQGSKSEKYRQKNVIKEMKSGE